MNVPIPSIPARWLVAAAVIAALVVLGGLVAEDWSTFGAWLGEHAKWVAQMALVSVAAGAVVVAFLVLQSTVMDAWTIAPEVRQAWLKWWKGYMDPSHTANAHDPLMMLAGAVMALGTSILIGLLALGVFLAAS